MSGERRLVRSALADFVPYQPGTSSAEVLRRFGIENPAKLSQNENPLGSSPRALAALRAVDSFHEYAEDDHGGLRGKIGARYGLGPDCVILGHGSNELIQNAFVAFVDPGDSVVIAAPSFSLFRKDAQIFGARQIFVPLRDGVHDLDAMLRAVAPDTKLVFVCDPNNPTGTRVDRAALAEFAAELPAGVLLVIDQAYREYMDDAGADGVDVLRTRPETLVLRTFSKIYGLASLRFGYGYASPQIVAWMNGARLPFNVSAAAAAAAAAALEDDEFVARSRAHVAAGKAYLAGEAARMGLRSYPSAANFVAIEVPAESDRAYEDLLRRGVIVRSGAALGMPGWLRVSVGRPDENAAFVAAVEELLPAWRTAAVAS